MLVIRSLLFQLFFWLWSVAMTVSHIPLLLVGGRDSLLGAMRRWAAGTMWGLRHLVRTRVEVRGAENIPQGAALIASKHLSMWETMMFHLVLPHPAFVLKRVLLFVPLYGLYALRSGMIAVDRSGHASSLRKMVTDARARLADQRQIIIFPEGTRKALDAAPDYKPGVAALYTQLGIPCVPVALNSGLYWPRKGLLRKPGTIIIDFLEPIPPGLRRKAFMETLERRIEDATRRLISEGSAVPKPELLENKQMDSGPGTPYL